MKLNVVYFAWVRERIGLPGEEIETSAQTVAGLVRDLAGRDERYALAFSDMTVVRAAADQTLCDLDTSLADVREVAFFPPMTGG